MQQLSMTQKQTMTSALRVEYFSTAWMAFEVDCKINPNAVRTKKISFL